MYPKTTPGTHNDLNSNGLCDKCVQCETPDCKILM